MTNSKRYIISTLETFLASFLGTFLLQIEQVINIWQLPTKELLISALIAWVIAWIKVIIKLLRESITK